MLRTNLRLAFFCALSLGVTACEEGLHIGGFDGSIDFDDDAGYGDGTRHDAATSDPEDDGGALGNDGGAAGGDRDGGIDAGSQLDAGGDDPPGAKVPALFARALCDALADCYGSATLRDDVLGGRDCVALNENTLENGELRYLPASIAAGLVRFDADQLGDCMSDIRALGCAARASRLPASCKAALAGRVLIAGECTINLDCRGDAFCDKDADGACPGRCTTLQSEGFACNRNDDDQCKDGLVCFRGTCEALRSVGLSCGEAEQPACKPGLECVDLLGDGLQCVAIASVYTTELGDACDPTDLLERCQSGLVCESVSSTEGVCAKPVGRGASCKRAQPNQCPPGQYCDAAPGEAGSCVDAPGDGDACRASKTPACADGHVCVDGTCRTVRANGGTCSTDRECYSGTCMDDICEAPLQCAAP